MDLIQNLKLTIANLRNSVENYHENWYNKAKKLAEKVDISEANMTKPRTCSRQIYRSNQPVQNTKEYFRVSLTIPFLDHVSADLEYRFPGDELTQYRGLYIIPYVMLNESSDWEKEFMVFANYYYEDFPNFNGLDAELEFWFNFWDCAKFKNNLPDSVSVTLKRVDSLAFLNIHVALKLLGTLPITTCECEWSFSSLRIVKTWDHSTMTNARLNGLALLFIHREIDLDVSEIIDLFAQKIRRTIEIAVKNEVFKKQSLQK